MRMHHSAGPGEPRLRIVFGDTAFALGLPVRPTYGDIADWVDDIASLHHSSPLSIDVRFDARAAAHRGAVRFDGRLPIALMKAMPSQFPVKTPLPPTPETAGKSGALGGLTSAQARSLLATLGPNAMPDTGMHPLRMALEKFWAPVPWMLEAAIVLQLVLGEYVEAAVIAALLVFNAALGLLPGGPRPGDARRAEVAAGADRVGAARRRMDHATRGRTGAGRRGEAVARRRGRRRCAAHRRARPARSVHAHRRIGARSRPGPGVQTYAGALVRRGEAVAEVTATGARTKFGRTAELVRTAHVVSTQQKAVLRVVRNLAAFNGVVIVLLVAYACFLRCRSARSFRWS